MQHMAARTAPIAPVVMRVRSRMAGSTSRRGGISRLRRRAGECGNVGPAIVVGHYRRLVLVRYDCLGHARHGFVAFSAAKAVEEARTLTAMAAEATSLLIEILRS